MLFINDREAFRRVIVRKRLSTNEEVWAEVKGVPHEMEAKLPAA